MEGFATKRGHIIRSWRVRWFCLENGELRYYKDSTKRIQKGCHTLGKDSTITPEADIGDRKNVLMLLTPGNPFRKRTLCFSVDNELTKDAWINAVYREINLLQLNEQKLPPESTSENNPSDTCYGINNANDSESDAESVGSSRVRSISTSGNRPRRPNSRGLTSRSKSSDNTDPIGVDSHNIPTTATNNKPLKSIPAAKHNKRLIGANEKVSTTNSNTANNCTGFEQTTTGVGIDTSSSMGGSPASKKRGSGNHSNAKQQEQMNGKYFSELATSAADKHNQQNQKSQQYHQPSSTNADGTSAHSNGSKLATVASETAGKLTPTKSAAESQEASPPFEGMRDIDENTKAKEPSGTGTIPVHESADCWIKAYTEDGQEYYYNKVTRAARWEKPNDSISAAVQERMEEIDQATQRRLQERREELEKERTRHENNERVRDENMTSIEGTIQKWKFQQLGVTTTTTTTTSTTAAAVVGRGTDRKNRANSGKELSFVELLRDLVLVLPSDLLLVVYTINSPHKAVLDTMQQDLSLTTPPNEVKKIYLKVMRLIHPDKLPLGEEISTESRLLMERVFILLTEKYDIYRKAHDL